ncbi:hypothetical protein [Leucobacter sp.]
MGNSKWKLATYKVKDHGAFSGNVKLLCGTSKGSGYRHINYRHKKDWFKKLNWKKNETEANWDLFMKSSVKAILRAPLSVYTQKDSKRCYQSTVTQKYIKKGKWWISAPGRLP